MLNFNISTARPDLASGHMLIMHTRSPNISTHDKESIATPPRPATFAVARKHGAPQCQKGRSELTYGSNDATALDATTLATLLLALCPLLLRLLDG
eukprot:1211522-Prymnesium_polylepis.1